MSEQRKSEEEMAGRGAEANESPTEERAEHARQGRPDTREYRVEGTAQLQQKEQLQGELQLHAYAFDRFGNPLGAAAVDNTGRFTLPVRMAQPSDVEVVIGPQADPKVVRQGRVYSHSIAAKQWGENQVIQLAPFPIAIDYWWWWLWQRICVNGHVYKVTDSGNCPVPFAKVEVFDVDRESCWWWYILRWWDYVIDRPVVRLPELLKDRVVQRPPPPMPPGPGPVERSNQVGPQMRPGEKVSFNPLPNLTAARLNPELTMSRGSMVSLNPQPEPPGRRLGDMISLNPQPEPPGAPLRLGDEASLNPQPLPPRTRSGEMQPSRLMMKQLTATTEGLVGEVRTIDAEVAARLSNLTITSVLPPWHYFPRCFYSQQEVCSTYTDATGAFNCCFGWWRFHVRHGRLRFDWLPDIIIKVTQTVNGVDHVIYMDPYTSTRWNVSTATIDLYLDDPRIVSACATPPPPLPIGTADVAFARIGNYDTVDQINRHTGCYDLSGFTNVAYGSTLNIWAQFGTVGLDSFLTDGSAQYYYRLSWSKATADGVGGYQPDGSGFNQILNPLRHHRQSMVNPADDAPNYLVGPKPIAGASGLYYEIPNSGGLAHRYFWWGEDQHIGVWDTTQATLPVPPQVAPHTGTYILRLEVFDSAGNLLTAASSPRQVHYVDASGVGAGISPLNPSPIPSCDLTITLDNDPLTFSLHTPATNDCGVIPWAATSGPGFVFTVHAAQPNNRVHSWSLTCVKGVSSYHIALSPGAATYNGGAGVPAISTDIPAAPLLTDPTPLTSTCAFALDLAATYHVRGSDGFLGAGDLLYAVAIERCECPPAPAPAST